MVKRRWALSTGNNMITRVVLTLLGQPVSKNAYHIIYRNFGGKKVPMVKKTADADAYVASIKSQANGAPMLEGDLKVVATLYYASRRPDLEESVLLDALQGIVYKNDRQIKEKHIYHAIDKENPRAEIEIECLEAEDGDI